MAFNQEDRSTVSQWNYPWQLIFYLLLFFLLITLLFPSGSVNAYDERELNQADDVSANAVLMGDVTCDNTLNVVDALAIMQYVVSIRTASSACPLESPTTTLNVGLGDVNASGAVDIVDALMVMQCDVGIENVLCTTDPAVFEIASVETETEAIEATGQAAEIVIRRTEGSDAAAINYTIGETMEPSRTSATMEDILLRDSAGNMLNGTIPFSAGQMEQRISIEAVEDTNIEVPERFRLILQDGAGYTINPNADEKALIIRDDEPGVDAESRLFVGLMEPEGSSVTSASGISIIRLSHDNSYGKIDYSFSGLTEEQTAAHLHYANPLSGPVIKSLPLGQIVDERWDILPAFTASTDQAMLDALLAGRLYINAHSVNYPAGEIRGTAQLTAGAPQMAPPQPPASISMLTGNELRRDIARFLTQATFGPNQDLVTDMEARIANNGGDRIAAYSQWIDEQMSMESPSLLEYYKAHNRLYNGTSTNAINNNAYASSAGVTEGWFTAATYSKAQLRERFGFALSEIFVVSLADPNLRQNPWGITDYYDMLRGGAFGDYRELLENISLHPAMGWYLSSIRNRTFQIGTDGELVVSPDQNYGREIMQLFSIGLVNLNLDGSLKLNEQGLPERTYTQDDIFDMSSVFTGWGFAVQNEDDGGGNDTVENNDFNFSGHPWRPNRPHDSWITPMKMFHDNGLPQFDSGYVRYHDNREKRVMGTVFPAGQTGEQDLARALDMLSEHPSTAPFVSYRLIQRLVTSNPSSGYIYRVASTFKNTNGDLGAVIKAILLDPEARNLEQTEQIGFGKKKEPLVQAVGALRAVEAHSTTSSYRSMDLLMNNGLNSEQVALYEADTSMMLFDLEFFAEGDASIGQSPLMAPTVFNYFKFNHTVLGAISEAGLVAPEFEQVNDNRLMQGFDFYHNLFINTNGISGARRSRTSSTIMRTTYDFPSWLVDPYMAIMDGNGNGQIDTNDTNFYSGSSVVAATRASLDAADLYLCDGLLKAEENGSALSDPYTIILNGLLDAHEHQDHRSNANALSARDGRLRMVLYVVSNAPQCAIQR